MYSTQEVADIARSYEAEAAEKKKRKRRKARSISVGLEENLGDIIEDISSESDRSCIEVVPRKVNKAS